MNVQVKGKISPPIIYAALRGRDKCIDLLLKSGANVNASNIWGETALLKAAAYGRDECMVLLLKAKADMTIAPFSGLFVGKSPLQMAACRGYPECVDLLIKAGVNVNELTKDDLVPTLNLAALAGYDKSVQLLIKAGADVNLTDKKGRTALFQAAYEGHDKCVRLLIKAGCDVNTTDVFGNPPLFASFGSVQCARLILMSGARVNTVNKKGRDIFEYRDVSYDRHVRWKTIRSVMKNEKQIRDMRAILSIFAIEDDSPPTELCLQSMCRHTIRKQLLQVNPNVNLLNSTNELGIPASIVSYLLYKKVSYDEVKMFVNKSRSKKSIK